MCTRYSFFIETSNAISGLLTKFMNFFDFFSSIEKIEIVLPKMSNSSACLTVLYALKFCRFKIFCLTT